MFNQENLGEVSKSELQRDIEDGVTMGKKRGRPKKLTSLSDTIKEQIKEYTTDSRTNEDKRTTAKLRKKTEKKAKENVD